MTLSTLDAIVHRHQPDPTELGRVCRACGRPWPCDVRTVVDALRVPVMRPGVRSARPISAKVAAPV